MERPDPIFSERPDPIFFIFSQINQWLGDELANYTPTVAGSIHDIRAGSGAAFHYAVPSDLFVDGEGDDGRVKNRVNSRIDRNASGVDSGFYFSQAA